MFDGYGWWVIFPIIGLVFMLLMMSRMLASGVEVLGAEGGWVRCVWARWA